MCFLKTVPAGNLRLLSGVFLRLNIDLNVVFTVSGAFADLRKLTFNVVMSVRLSVHLYICVKQLAFH
jgi:hypothetical protein